MKEIVDAYEKDQKKGDLFRVNPTPGLCVINTSPQYEGVTSGLHKLLPDELA